MLIAQRMVKSRPECAQAVRAGLLCGSYPMVHDGMGFGEVRGLFKDSYLYFI